MKEEKRVLPQPSMSQEVPEKLQFQIKNSPFTSFKISSMPFSPNAPHQAMWDGLPDLIVPMSTKTSLFQQASKSKPQRGQI